MAPAPGLLVFLAVGLGGAIGSMCRFLMSSLLPGTTGTFTVNIVGSFAVGVIAGIVGRGAGAGELGVRFLTTGFLGGFTTFSAFSIEAAGLMKEGRTVEPLIYAVASVLGGILAAVAGMRVGGVR